MNDMSSTIIAKSDQINAADIIGRAITMTVREVQIKAAGSDDQPVSIYFEGETKAFRPCKGVRRLLVHAWGADANKYIGRSLTLFCDPSVTWAGKEEGGIRVSHMSDIEGEFVFSMRTSRAATKPYRIKPLVQQQRQTPAGLTIDQAADILRGSFDLDELRTNWTSKKMAPFRDDLADVLAEMKTALAPVSEHENKGETHALGPDDLILKIASKTRQQDVLEFIASHADTIAAFDEEDVLRIEEAKAMQLGRIKGAA